MKKTIYSTIIIALGLGLLILTTNTSLAPVEDWFNNANNQKINSPDTAIKLSDTYANLAEPAPNGEIKPTSPPLSSPTAQVSSSSANNPTASIKATSSLSSLASLMTVSFMSQAPTGHWSDLRQEDGCEEASTLMAVTWSRNKTLPSGATAEKALITLADWEQKTYQNYHDTSIQDTADRILKNYFTFSNYQVKTNQTTSAIKAELAQGNIIIAPMNGTKLNNPNFKQPGPMHHMLVIIGYDAKTQEFITNDPGTRKGASYRYPESIINAAWRDYPTGEHLPTTTIKKDLIVIRPS